MSPLRLAAGLIVAALTLAGVGFASRAPYAPPGAERAILRLSWRVRAEKVEACRPRTAEELAALPAHMRTPEVCTGHAVGYRLVLRVDEAPPDTLLFQPAGARADRPVYVLHDRTLEPGAHRVRMEFAATRPTADSAPLGFDGRVVARPGHVALITLSPDASRFVTAGAR